jgi:hypothetical protein
MVPRSGDVLVVDHQASVQFSGRRRLRFRVISVCEKPTYQGWAWVNGYVLDDSAAATERREIFIRLDGLRPFEPSARRPATGAVR